MIYLDYAATTPMSDEALETYTQVAKQIYGNSQSLHDLGTKAEDLLQICREQFAKMLSCEKEGIYFTSGGTDGNLLTLSTLIQSYRHKGNHIITTPVEHSSILNFFNTLSQFGFEITFLKMNQDGILCIEDLKKQIRPTTILASIQFGNSEYGTIQPIHEIGTLLKKKNILFHCDAVQAFGKIPIPVKDYNIHALTISSHKIYGPKGTGACYLSPHIPWQPLIQETTHQSGFRGGTLDLPSIAAFTTTALITKKNLIKEQQRLMGLKKYFISEISQSSLPVTIVGNKDETLPHIIGMTVEGIEGQHLLLEANRKGYAISTGSACRIGLQKPSPALLSLGFSKEKAKSFIRISFGKDTEIKHLDLFISDLHTWISEIKGVIK